MQNRRCPRRFIALLSLTAACTWLCLSSALCASASAQEPSEEATRTEARELGAAGLDDLEAGRLAEATQKLDRAYGLFAVPTLGLWSARARVQIGHWLEAAERYRETIALSAALGDSAAQDQAKQEASAELDKLLQRIPSFVIQLHNATISEILVTLDAVAVPAAQLNQAIFANPGTHKLVATRGSERVESTLQLTAGQRHSSSLEFHARNEPTVVAANLSVRAGADDPTMTSSTLRGIGIAGVAIGAVGLATAAVAAIVANNNLKDCAVVDGWHTCQEPWQLDNYNAAKTIATVAFWSGVGAAVLGTATLISGMSEPKQLEAKSTVSWTISPTFASVKATF